MMKITVTEDGFEVEDFKALVKVLTPHIKKYFKKKLKSKRLKKKYAKKFVLIAIEGEVNRLKRDQQFMEAFYEQETSQKESK